VEHWWASHQWHPQRQIDATDPQTCPDEGRTDQLVYELCGLTDEEIRIVEEAAQR